MKKIFSTLTVCVAMVSVTNAQDPNFSQFFASPLTLNPARQAYLMVHSGLLVIIVISTNN